MAGNIDTLTLQQVVTAIGKGDNLIIAADESLLTKLPRGNWIGGTTPYFMSRRGGQSTQEFAYVQRFADSVSKARISFYDESSIDRIYQDADENGFSAVLIPAFSKVHSHFGLSAPSFALFGVRPLVGWVTGTNLKDLKPGAAKVFNGQTLESKTDQAIAIHAKLPETKFADVSIVNIFTPANDSPILEFEKRGFDIDQVIVKGRSENFRDYLTKNKIDTRWPLIGDYGGISVNLSFSGNTGSTVQLLAPVFPGVKYRFASPRGDYSDYLSAFRAMTPDLDEASLAFSCNCVLNYAHGNLDGQVLPELSGPFVFGEIAYQLLNQTAVFMTVNAR